VWIKHRSPLHDPRGPPAPRRQQVQVGLPRPALAPQERHRPPGRQHLDGADALAAVDRPRRAEQLDVAVVA
jgi:hypothetical protein